MDMVQKIKPIIYNEDNDQIFILIIVREPVVAFKILFKSIEGLC